MKDKKNNNLFAKHVIEEITPLFEEFFKELDKQYDQINYLIGLISQQEEILKTNMDSKENDKGAGERWERYLELHKEFSEELDDLHEMMVDVSGLSRKDFRGVVLG